MSETQNPAPVPPAPTGSASKANLIGSILALLLAVLANVQAGDKPTEDEVSNAVQLVAKELSSKGEKSEDGVSKNILELQGAVNALSLEVAQLRNEVNGLKAAATVPGGPSEDALPQDAPDAGAETDTTPDVQPQPESVNPPEVPNCPPREGDVFKFTAPQKTY